MSNFYSLLFVINLLLFYSIEGKKVCDFSDVECTSKGAKHSYKTILGAFVGESPDPMYYDKIETDLGPSKYRLINITVTGMNNCEIQRLECKPKEMTFDYYLLCPQLVFTANFEAEGPVGTIPIQGKGVTRITTDNYLISCNGKFEKFISEVDQKPHVNITFYDLNFEPKGKLTFELVELFTGDKDKFDLATNFMNENWMEMEKIFRQPIISVFYRRFFDKYVEALATVPLEDILPVV